MKDQHKPDPTQKVPKSNIANILAWLKSPEYKNKPYGDVEAMERAIQENRNAWDAS